jgi:hypothetical protein
MHGRFVGNTIYIDRVIIADGKRGTDTDIEMRLVQGSNPARYEPV